MVHWEVGGGEGGGWYPAECRDKMPHGESMQYVSLICTTQIRKNQSRSFQLINLCY